MLRRQPYATTLLKNVPLDSIRKTITLYTKLGDVGVPLGTNVILINGHSPHQSINTMELFDYPIEIENMWYVDVRSQVASLRGHAGLTEPKIKNTATYDLLCNMGLTVASNTYGKDIYFKNMLDYAESVWVDSLVLQVQNYYNLPLVAVGPLQVLASSHFKAISSNKYSKVTKASMELMALSAASRARMKKTHALELIENAFESLPDYEGTVQNLSDLLSIGLEDVGVTSLNLATLTAMFEKTMFSPTGVPYVVTGLENADVYLACLQYVIQTGQKSVMGNIVAKTRPKSQVYSGEYTRVIDSIVNP